MILRVWTPCPHTGCLRIVSGLDSPLFAFAWQLSAWRRFVDRLRAFASYLGRFVGIAEELQKFTDLWLELGELFVV